MQGDCPQSRSRFIGLPRFPWLQPQGEAPQNHAISVIAVPGLVAIFLKGRTNRPWAKPRVGSAKRSAAHARGIAAEIPQAPQGLRTCSGKPGWSYFCIRVADTKILLAHATRVFGAEAPKRRASFS
jgi:hypothetical protein